MREGEVLRCCGRLFLVLAARYEKERPLLLVFLICVLLPALQRGSLILEEITGQRGLGTSQEVDGADKRIIKNRAGAL